MFDDTITTLVSAFLLTGIAFCAVMIPMAVRRTKELKKEHAGKHTHAAH